MATRKKSTGKKSARKAPWERSAPTGSSHRRLTPKKKSAAKAKARRAGRPYPNLVDNMRAAGKSGGRKKSRKK